MTKTRGIKHGQTIELLESSQDIPEGVEIQIEVSIVHPLSKLSAEERQVRIGTVLGAWKDDKEIDEIFAEIDRERHTYPGRLIEPLDA
jgi:hypothetical protein